MAKIEREAVEQEERERKEAQRKKQEIKKQEEQARRRRDQPVGDSEIVEEMFGFLGDKEQGSPPRGYIYFDVKTGSLCIIAI